MGFIQFIKNLLNINSVDHESYDEYQSEAGKENLRKKRKSKKRPMQNIKQKMIKARKGLRIAEEAITFIEPKRSKKVDKSSVLLRGLQLLNSLKVGLFRD